MLAAGSAGIEAATNIVVRDANRTMLLYVYGAVVVLCFITSRSWRAVALVGITLPAGVITWAWSPIKFQADMGILLTFMFIWNMVGALVLIPALSHFLLRKVR